MAETAARRAGEQELLKRLDAGESVDSAVYRGWLEYHNRQGGTDSWQTWQGRYGPTRKAQTMGKKSKLQKALDNAAPMAPSVPRHVALRPVSIAGSNSPRGGSNSTIATAPFDERVNRAEVDLAKARERQDEYAIALAKQELQEARGQRTTLKLMIAEEARERDPSATLRAIRGQGVPLVTNRHALRDDPQLREW